MVLQKKPVRQLELNNPPILRRIFVRLRSCCVGRIVGYVTEATRSKTDKKASKMGGLFASSCLSSPKKTDNRLDYLVGNGIGFLSSLLGIGGGTLTVPYLVGRQVPMKNAVAISSACGFPIAISGTVFYAFLGWDKNFLSEWSLGYIYLPVLCGIVTCSILTAPLGAKLANKLPAKKLKRYFSVVIFLIAIKMIIN
jgi:uncharacterized membrane protein YfcA